MVVWRRTGNTSSLSIERSLELSITLWSRATLSRLLKQYWFENRYRGKSFKNKFVVKLLIVAFSQNSALWNPEQEGYRNGKVSWEAVCNLKNIHNMDDKIDFFWLKGRFAWRLYRKSNLNRYNVKVFSYITRTRVETFSKQAIHCSLVSYVLCI